MTTKPSTTTDRRTRAHQDATPLPPPPLGVKMMTRPEAAAFLGLGLKTFTDWERHGRVAIPRYRARTGTGRAMFYARADLERLREEVRAQELPAPDPERPGVYRVPIRSRLHNMVALIDAADLPKVEGKHWNVRVDTADGTPEVVLSSVTERIVPLKRVIMGVDAPEFKDQLVCFKNGDPLDCRRANLAVTTFAAKAGSTAKIAARAGRPTSSKYKGVHWDATRRFWLAQIGSREKHHALGRFRDEAQAAAAYDAAARNMFGPAALLNFPDGNIPAPTFLDPDGQIVREKHAYRVPRGLPVPPPGAAMLTREEAALALDVSTGTLGIWERAGDVSIPRYRAKDQTGANILYAASDIASLREELDKVGQPYADPHPDRAGVWRVPLRTLSGYIEALIDEADLHIVQGKKWNFVKHTGGGLRGGDVIMVGQRDAHKTLLKRLILGLENEGPNTRIIYANGNPLDCRRANLIIRGRDQSTQRGYKILQRSGRPTSSRFKGVCWNEREGKWQSQIRVDDKPKKLGMFDDQEDAAYAYDEAARELWGADARVNFPEPGELPSAAAPVDPAELSPRAPGAAARLPGKPIDFAAVLNDGGSVTISWRSTNSAASAGVTFGVSRRLPGQSAFTRIATTDGSTSQTRRPCFTDTTVPASALTPDSAGTEYLVQGARGEETGEASDVLVVKSDATGRLLTTGACVQKVGTLVQTNGKFEQTSGTLTQAA